MPTLEHNGIVEMFRDKPSLAPHLIERLFHLRLPSHASVKVVESSLDQLIPVEFRADLVLELVGEEGAPVLLIVLEMQRDEDPDKKYSWPVYVTVARARRRCQAMILVVAPDEKVAAWCAEPIDVGLGLTTTRPLVVGPAVVPYVIDPTEAERETELAILSAVAHGNGPNGRAVVAAAVGALGRLDREHAAVYFQVVYNGLREPMRRALEALVMERQTEGKTQFPPFFQKLIDQAMEEASAKARSEAGAAEAARALLTVLRARGMTVPDAVRERIQAEKDLAQLERWIERAAVAGSLADAIENPS